MDDAGLPTNNMAIEGTQLANTDEVVNYISKHGDFPLITLTSDSF